MDKTLKALYKFNNKALKALNTTFSIDYNKPMQTKAINGNTTINKILKSIDHDNNTLILALTTSPGYYSNVYRVAIIDNSGGVEVKKGYSNYHFIYNSGIDNYYTKSDFKEAIKNPESHTIVIAQSKQYLKEQNKHSIDYSQRYILSNPTYENEYYCYTTTGSRYVNRLRLKETFSNGYKIEYCTDHYNNQTENISDIIDKSGYIIEEKHRQLKCKAKALRDKKKKDAFIASDNSKQIEELDIRIKAKKLELIEKLKKADTSETLEEVGKAIGRSWSNGFTDIVRNFEDMKKGIEEKSYKSIDDFNNHYNRISNALMKI